MGLRVAIRAGGAEYSAVARACVVKERSRVAGGTVKVLVATIELEARGDMIEVVACHPEGDRDVACRTVRFSSLYIRTFEGLSVGVGVALCAVVRKARLGRELHATRLGLNEAGKHTEGSARCVGLILGCVAVRAVRLSMGPPQTESTMETMVKGLGRQQTEVLIPVASCAIPARRTAGKEALVRVVMAGRALRVGAPEDRGREQLI